MIASFMPAPRPLEELAQEDIGLFQTHMLRAYAPSLRWYYRPLVAQSPYKLDDFLEIFRKKLVSTLKPPEKIGVQKQDLSLDRPILKHLCYNAVGDSVRRHNNEIHESELASRWSQNSAAFAHNGNIKLHTPHHPLYSNYKAKPAAGGLLMKKFDISHSDRNFASWFSRQQLIELIRATPEFTQPSPDVQVAICATNMRSELKALLHNVFVMDDKTASDGIEIMTNEWLTLSDFQRQDTPELEYLFEFYELQAVQDDVCEILQRVPSPSMLKTAEEEACLAPLYEYICITGNCDKFIPEVHAFAAEWSATLARLQVASCDRPTLGIAMLSSMLRDPAANVKEICERL
jgi:hypothetical protein